MREANRSGGGHPSGVSAVLGRYRGGTGEYDRGTEPPATDRVGGSIGERASAHVLNELVANALEHAFSEERPGEIRIAFGRLQEKLQNRHPGNGHDDWEWRKILDTYPLPRLLHFLESDSPRAVRLRQSSPFPEVMSDRERERLGELIERPN